MTKKRTLILAIVLVILGALVYLQFREWRTFDWAKFEAYLADLQWWRVAIAVLLIYLTYWLRAVRWKLFLKPVCRARLRSLVPTQYIGFTGLALLGRPGELIRPYLIAKKEQLTFSSQMAVWAVERIFDIGAFAVLVCLDVFLVPVVGYSLPHISALRKLAGALLCIVAAMALLAWFIKRHGPAVANWVEPKVSRLSQRLGKSVCHKIRAFGEGLDTIRDAVSFVQLAGMSLLIWFAIALAYRFVVHAYPPTTGVHHLHVPQVLLLMASSMVGSLIQLPAVGGGSQLAVISMLSSPEWFGPGTTYNIQHELAVSAGILLWLVTFMAVIPVGLALSHHEHVSLRKITEESEHEEEQTDAPVERIGNL